MVKFINSALITSVFNDAGVFVIDSDLQGTWATGEQFYFKDAFPKLYKQYVKTCFLDRENKVGTAMLFEEDGYKIAVLFTKEHRHGRIRQEDLQLNFQNAVLDLFRLVPSDIPLFSPILGRVDHCGNEYFKTLNRLLKPIGTDKPRQWFVYLQKGYGHANYK